MYSKNFRKKPYVPILFQPMSHSRVHSALAEATPQNQRAVPGASVVVMLDDSQDVSSAETQPGVIDKRPCSPTPDPMDPPQKGPA